MDKPAKLVVLISGRGSNLKSIIDQLDNLNAEVVAILSNKEDAPGLAYAKHCASYVVKPENYDSREAFDKQMMVHIDSHNPDLVILAGFMRILSAQFVQHYKNKLLNIHPSLLPKYKGINTHQRAIDAGDSIHGATVHFVTAALDSGPIVMQAEVLIGPEDTAQSLADKVLLEEHKLYPKAIAKILNARG